MLAYLCQLKDKLFHSLNKIQHTQVIDKTNKTMFVKSPINYIWKMPQRKYFKNSNPCKRYQYVLLAFNLISD